MEPYCLISDVHLHNWSAFAEVGDDGVNSRLRATLAEIIRAASVLQQEYKGRFMVCAGDLFHVRGQIAPSVLNPVLDVFRELRDAGIQFITIPGNHDLSSRDAQRLHSTITPLESVGAITINQPSWRQFGGAGGPMLAFVPWFTSATQVRQEAEMLRAELEARDIYPRLFDLVIHAPLDGVLPGLPNHGLTPQMLADLGFNRVFCGHYHNHKEFTGGVYSVGALNHQSWNDVASNCGFLIVTVDRVVHYDSLLPKFVDLSMTPGAQWEEQIAGNYVRVKAQLAPENTQFLKDELLAAGARGVTVQPINLSTPMRPEGVVKAGASLADSIREFIRQQQYEQPEELTQTCLEVLHGVSAHQNV